MVKAVSSTPMAMCMRVYGTMTELKEEAHTNMLMVQNTLVTGKMIDNMDTESKLGRIMPGMKETMSSVKNKTLVHLSGQTVPLTLENSTKTIFMGKEFTRGQIKENTRATGEPIKCMAKEHSHGLMEESMLVSIATIKRKGTVNSCGPMAGAIEASGKAENNMVKEHTSRVAAKKNTESGGMEKESDGLGAMSKIDFTYD